MENQAEVEKIIAFIPRNFALLKTEDVPIGAGTYVPNFLAMVEFENSHIKDFNIGYVDSTWRDLSLEDEVYTPPYFHTLESYREFKHRVLDEPVELKKEDIVWYLSNSLVAFDYPSDITPVLREHRREEFPFTDVLVVGKVWNFAEDLNDILTDELYCA